MKITDKHRFILGKVRLISATKGSLGGAALSEISGTDADVVRAVKALAKAGFLETFRTPPADRTSPSGLSSYVAGGHLLFCIGQKGADLLVKEAFEVENRKSLLERVASHLKGIDPEYVLRSKPTEYLRDGWMNELGNHVAMMLG